MESNPPPAAGVGLAVRVLAYALGGVLGYSAIAHIENPYAFLDTVYSYQIIGVEPGVWVAAGVPFVQLVLAMTLLGGVWLREGFALSLLMFVAFVGAQGLAVYRGQDISCGCFGAADGTRIGWRTLALAGTCAAAAAAGLILSLRGRNGTYITSATTGVHSD